MKKKRNLPAIIVLVVAVACAIFAVVLFFTPSLFIKKGPITISQSVKLSYFRHDDGEDWYEFSGKLKNVSDETVTIDGYGGMVITYKHVKGASRHSWLENDADIVLQPGEEYDFANADLIVNDNAIDQIKINVNGTSYTLYDSDGNVVLIVVMVFACVLLVIIGIALLKNSKDAQKRDALINNLCAQIGGDCVVINGAFSNKDEEKKAAAKTAAWAIGGFISALFLGGGVFRVYGGGKSVSYVLSDDALYLVDATAGNQAPNVTRMTKNELGNATFKTKKNRVTMTAADGKTYCTLLTKNSGLTSEQVVGRLTDIFVNGKSLITATAESSDGQPAPDVDVFDEFAAKPAESAAPTEEVAATEATDGENVKPDSDGGEQ